MQQMILGSFDGDWYVVQSSEQARLLTEPTARRLLEPFIGAERTLTQAAREVGCSVQRLRYRVQQFMRAGLLTETRQERRSGRPLRYYRAVSDGFCIPFEVTPFADLEAMIARQYAPSDRLRNRSAARRARARQQGTEGRRIYRDARTGEIHNESAGRSEASERLQSNDVALTVRLWPQEAQAFMQEFQDLYARLQAAHLPRGQGQAFLVHFGVLLLAPEDLERPERSG